jgi:hypothetical protein
MRPANSIKVFLGPRANAELVPKFHVAQHASHAAHVLVLTARCKLINFFFQIFPLFISEISADLTPYIAQIIYPLLFYLDPVTTAI